MAYSIATHTLVSLFGIDLSDWSSPTPDSSPQAETQEPSTESRLLQCPPDVLLSICDHLDTPAALCLALACRDTYAVCFSLCNQKMLPEESEQLLCLLERDPLGVGHYYCNTCVKLHPFDEAWAPQCDSEGSKGHGDYHCGNRDRFSPVGNGYDLTYSHARLVMNRHLFGPSHGIPLANICIDHQQHRDLTTVDCTTDARVLDDELFLHRTYSFRVADSDVPALRSCAGSRDFNLCEHTALFSSPSRYRQHIAELHRQPLAGTKQLVPCRRVPGSCGLCLMDYDVTVAEADEAGDWQVTVNAYHLLGPCRSPDDWRWARFTEAARPHLLFPNRPNRRSSKYNAGAVYQRWTKDDRLHQHSDAESPRGSDSLVHFFSSLSWPWKSTLASN